MKITIIGASGKVSRQCLAYLFTYKLPDNIWLTLISRNIRPLRGLIKEVESLPFYPHNNTVTISDNLRAASNSDLIIIAVANWPSNREKKLYKKKDSSGRLAQSFSNIGLIHHIMMTLGNLSPESLVIIVTNQSDMMSHIARMAYSGTRVLGFGGMVDTMRLRGIIDSPSAQTIGYHNIFA